MATLTINEENAIINYISEMYMVMDEVRLLRFLQDHDLIKDTDEVIEEIMRYKKIPEDISPQWLNFDEMINDSISWEVIINDKCLNTYDLNYSQNILIEDGIILTIQNEENSIEPVNKKEVQLEDLYEEIQEVKSMVSKLDKKFNKIQRVYRRQEI